MTVEESPSDLELEQAKRRLTVELAEVRRGRIADEREAARLDGVRLALAAARRDRDAGTHSRLRSARSSVERSVRDYEQLLVEAGRLLARAHTARLSGDDPRLSAVETVVSRDVQEAARMFAAAINDDARHDTSGGAR